MVTMASHSLQVKLFRRQAVTSARQRWLGDVVVATPPGSMVAAAVAVCACLAICLSTVIVRVPERIQAAGTMLPAGRIIRVLAPRAGTIGDLDVQEGDAVRAGQSLLGIGAPPVAGSRSNLEDRQRSLERELAALDGEATASERSLRTAEANNRQRAALVRRHIDAAEAEAGLLRAQLGIAERRLGRGQLLRASGGIATQQLDNLEAEMLQARLQLATAGDKRYALERELALLDSDLRRQQEAGLLQALRHARERERVKRELLELADEQRIVVVAPGAGIAGGVVVAEGSTVRAGELLMQIVEPDAELQAHVYISADDAGRLRPGQAIELQLRAYPHRLYGTWTATVQQISTVPLPAGSLPSPLSGVGPVYELRAVPRPSAEGAGWPLLAPGATFAAEVVTRRWPLYRWLLRGGRAAA